MSAQMKRIDLLKLLLQAKQPITGILEELGKEGWDCETPLILLTRAHIVAVLNQYINGQLSSTQVEEWANAIECREDIGLEAEKKDLLSGTIFQLANPTLTEKLSKEMATTLIDLLK